MQASVHLLYFCWNTHMFPSHDILQILLSLILGPYGGLCTLERQDICRWMHFAGLPVKVSSFGCHHAAIAWGTPWTCLNITKCTELCVSLIVLLLCVREALFRRSLLSANNIPARIPYSNCQFTLHLYIHFHSFFIHNFQISSEIRACRVSSDRLYMHRLISLLINPCSDSSKHDAI